MTIIGLSGLRGAGKSTIAKMISKLGGYHVKKFAGPLYAAFDGLVDNRVTWAGPIALPGSSDYAEYGEDLTTPSYKTHKFSELGDASPVDWLEAIGRGARDHIRPSIWVDLAMDSLPDDGTNVVFDDVRYQNEADAIRARGGFVVRIERLGLTADLFEQERGLPEPDYVVVNPGNRLSDADVLAGQIVEEARQRKFGDKINPDRV